MDKTVLDATTLQVIAENIAATVQTDLAQMHVCVQFIVID